MISPSKNNYNGLLSIYSKLYGLLESSNENLASSPKIYMIIIHHFRKMSIQKFLALKFQSSMTHFADNWWNLHVTNIFGTTGSGKIRVDMDKYVYLNYYCVTDYKHSFNSYNQYTAEAGGMQIEVLPVFRHRVANAVPALLERPAHLLKQPVALCLEFGQVRIACSRGIISPALDAQVHHSICHTASPHYIICCIHEEGAGASASGSSITACSLSTGIHTSVTCFAA